MRDGSMVFRLRALKSSSTAAGPTSGQLHQPGASSHGRLRELLRYAGVGCAYLAIYVCLDWLSFSGISQRMKDNQADAGFITAGIPTAAVMELTSTADIDFLNLDDALIKKITDTWPFYAKVTIPAGTYRGQDKAVNTVAVMAQWVTDAQIPDDTIYELTKALWEEGTHVLRGDKAPSAATIMGQVHAKGKDVQLRTALDGMAIPLHPGAVRYYKEKGLIK